MVATYVNHQTIHNYNPQPTHSPQLRSLPFRGFCDALSEVEVSVVGFGATFRVVPWFPWLSSGGVGFTAEQQVQ